MGINVNIENIESEKNKRRTKLKSKEKNNLISDSVITGDNITDNNTTNNTIVDNTITDNTIVYRTTERIGDTIEIIRLFRENGMILKPGVADLLLNHEKSEILLIINKLKENKKKDFSVISKEDIIKLGIIKLQSSEQETKVPSFVEIKHSSDFRPLAKEYGHSFSIEKKYDITNKSKCTGELNDFVNYINDRYEKSRKILIARPSKNRIINTKLIDSLSKGDKARIIGIVNLKRITKNGHVMIELEDGIGTTMVIALNNKKSAALFEKATKVVTDEVIAVDIWKGQNFSIADDIIWPDIPIKEKKRIQKDISIAFLSDTHIGNKLFMAKEFERMLKWLNGSFENGGDNERSKKIAEKIGYLLIAGDIADGIGNYPNQEKDLSVRDVYEQYQIFNEFMEMVPDHIKVIIIPGNHDVVRRAQPQPALSKEFIRTSENVYSTGNPAYINIEGFRVLMYHGDSIEGTIANIPGLNFNHPEEVMVEFLKRRELCLTYERSDIAPEHKDYLFVEECDILHTGHIHRNGYTEYRGTVAINSGAWIGQTEDQKKRGLIPTPCILPIYNLKEGFVTHINFSGKDIMIN